ncbi:MAG: VanZ family protein [Lachnospiraceae bacterium]|nr:VanZ family protein [Lachnospiraceae bacterium]MDD3617445.1 VanZ family protein [Lachnospiraceae bacterium]
MSEKIKRMIRLAGSILFVVYILLLIYFLFFAEWYGRGPVAIEREYHYNLQPFYEIRRFWNYRNQLGFRAVFLNLAGNVIGFLPFGFILPVISRWFRNFGMTVCSGFFLSVLIECIQLYSKVGSFDVDDMILNTLGAVLGYLLYAICDWIRRKKHGKKI